MWFVYILNCKNGDLYTGITDNIERRLSEHQSGKGGHFTGSFGANEIVFSGTPAVKISEGGVNRVVEDLKEAASLMDEREKKLEI